MTPAEMAAKIGRGLLSFPVTHFDAKYQFDEHGFRDHCGWLLERDVAGLFAAGGTGEFFSLTPAEVTRVVRAAVEETAGRVPVIAGCGYGTQLAIELARGAEAAGANGLLLLPPYLVKPSQEGLAAHIEAVCRATPLGVIVYNRDNAVLTAETLARLIDSNPNLVGFKDGVGDIDLFVQVRATLGDRLVYIGGLPTAETFASAYLAMGVTTYSSAIMNFLPDWAMRFYIAVRAGNTEFVERELTRFVLPYIAIRDRSPGYAVAIIKAGMKVVGRPAGPVRPPLADLTISETKALRELIASKDV